MSDKKEKETMKPRESAHNDRVAGGPATRRHRYPGVKGGERWDYNKTANLAPNAEVEHWNPETGRWE